MPHGAGGTVVPFTPPGAGGGSVPAVLATEVAAAAVVVAAAAVSPQFDLAIATAGTVSL